MKPHHNGASAGTSPKRFSALRKLVARAPKQMENPEWHRQVDLIMDHHEAINNLELSDFNFPLVQLQSVTNLYLRGRLGGTPQETDLHLLQLVTEHQEMDVAIGACSHALSAEAVLSLISETQARRVETHGELQYLHSTAIVHHTKPEIVDSFHAEWAKILVPLLVLDIQSIVPHIQRFVSRLSLGVPREPLLFSFRRIASRALSFLEAELEGMVMKGQQLRALQTSAWLWRIPGTSPVTENELDNVFVKWRMWAKWRPSTSRLQLWEGLKAKEREGLQDVLALEGPDYIGGQSTTLRAALYSQHLERPSSRLTHRRLRVGLENGNGDEPHQSLNRLLAIFDTICQSSRGTMRLFKHICLRGEVNADSMNLLEQVIATEDQSASVCVLEILSAQSGSGKVAAIIQALPILDRAHTQELRRALSSDIIPIINAEASRLQNKFCDELEKGNPAEGPGKRLHEFGNHLQQVAWIKPFLDQRLCASFEQWPNSEDLEALFQIRTRAQGATTAGNSSIVEMANRYCMSSLVARGELDQANRGIVGDLIQLWRQPMDYVRREVAFAIVERSNIPVEVRQRCVAQLKNLRQAFIHGICSKVSQDTDMACVNLTRFFVSQRGIHTAEMACWRELLLCVVKQRDQTLLEYSLSHLNVESWLQWMENLREIFHNGPDNSRSVSDVSDTLNLALLHWTQRLSRNHLCALKKLEEILGLGPVLRWILTGWEDSRRIIPFLQTLENPDQGELQPVVDALMAMLSLNEDNGQQVCEVLSLLSGTTTQGQQACISVVKKHQESLTELSHVLIAGWLRSSEMSQADVRALTALGAVLGIGLYANGDLPTLALQKTAEYLETEHSTLTEEALYLESIRLTLMAHDRRKTSALIARLDIEPGYTEGFLRTEIPGSLVDVIERTGNREFELFFPLTHLKPLQRAALAVTASRSLLVRLVPGDSTTPSEFCMHLDPDLDNATTMRQKNRIIDFKPTRHSYWPAGRGTSAPDIYSCFGRPSRTIYQLSRALWRHLVGGFRSLEAVHKLLTDELHALSSKCLVCGSCLRIHLWRSTTCRKECSIILRLSDPEVHLSDLYNEPSTVDLLLSTVHAAATSTKITLSTLLPECPITTSSTLTSSLNALPGLETFQNAYYLKSSVRQLGNHSESLLSWVCTSHRGFLAPATGALKIPSMPGVHQFILANTAPELERAFAAHLKPNQPTRVVFHGTTLDRLYAIICQGLLEMTGTALAQYGGIYGRGVYAANEVTTSLSYARTSSSAWKASKFHNVRVVLGCELALDDNTPGAPPGIWVIRPASRVIVRYVFLFPATGRAPIANHVVPAMQSVFASLRLGAQLPTALA